MVKGYDRFMKKILIVEDDKGLNDGLVYDLREEGYEVSSALTAMLALKTFRLQAHGKIWKRQPPAILPGYPFRDP